VGIKATPGLPCALDQIEHHRTRGLVSSGIARSDPPMPHVAKVLSVRLVVLWCFQCSAGKS
jgi:hypothetical protein